MQAAHQDELQYYTFISNLTPPLVGWKGNAGPPAPGARQPRCSN